MIESDCYSPVYSVHYAVDKSWKDTKVGKYVEYDVWSKSMNEQKQFSHSNWIEFYEVIGW